MSLLVPLTLAATLGACNETTGAVQPGIVNTAAPGAVPDGYRGEQGRVVAMNDTTLRGGGGGSRMNDGTLVGGGVGMAGGAAIGSAVSHSLGGTLIGGLLGAVGGAIAGTAIGQHSGTRHGVEVTVEKDDGQKVTIAQPDDGSLQVGDRVMIAYGRDGVAKAVPDSGNNVGQRAQRDQRDYPPQQDYPPQRDYPPQQDYPPQSPQQDYQPRS
ncbi:MAG: hypothetical protein ACHQK9_06150 [Reyranellales bacterium]